MARAETATVARVAPFAGVPYLLMELASMWASAPRTNSDAWMKNLRAPIDSDSTRRIKAAGFVPVGKSDAPENGWAITTAAPVWPQWRLPRAAPAAPRREPCLR
jgi:amidase